VTDVQMVEKFSGTSVVDRRRLLRDFASMTDEQRNVVMEQQTVLMRRRVEQKRQHETKSHVWAHAMLILALFQFHHAKESMKRKRQLSEEDFALLDKHRQSLYSKPRKGSGRRPKALEFVRANYYIMQQWLDAGVSWREMPEVIKEHFRGQTGAQVSWNGLYRAFCHVTTQLDGSGEVRR